MRTPTPYIIHPSNSAPARGLTRDQWAQREASRPENVKARWTPTYRATVERLAKAS